MDIIEKLYLKSKNQKELKSMDLLGRISTYSFEWNLPITIENLEKIKREYNLNLPKEYEYFLLRTNGANLYNDSENAGYRLLSLEEAIAFTDETKQDGFDLDDNYLIFMRTMFSEDFLLFDLTKCKSNKYIIDGDVGYPKQQWDYIKGGFNTLMLHLFQTNGDMYWRW